MKNVLLVVFALLNFNSIIAQQNIPAFIKDSLDIYIKQEMQNWEIPGMAVGIIKDNEIIFVNTYGHTKKGAKPIDENTLFMIGSNTKLFTATGITILKSADKLSHRDKVQKWMPEFKLKNELAAKETRIVDLLSHQIGFKTFQGDFTYWESNLTRAEVIEKMSLIDAPYGFRTRWGYCNAGYVTVGEIFPRVIGKTWEETIRDSILTPLGMKETFMLSTEFMKQSNIAYPHSRVNGEIKEIPIVDIASLAAAGSMSSSINDMLIWVQAQLDAELLRAEDSEKPVIPDMAFLRTRYPYSIIHLDQRDSINQHFYLYGLGLDIKDFKGKMVYSHTGGVNGYLSHVLFAPEDNFGLVILTNSDDNYFYLSLAYDIRDIFFDVDFQNRSKSYLENAINYRLEKQNELDSLRSLIKEKHPISIPLKSFTGNYRNELYGQIEIKLKKDKLKIYFSNHPDLIGHLEHIKENEFLCTYSNSVFGVCPVVFKLKDDQVNGLSLRVASHVEYDAYEFVKK